MANGAGTDFLDFLGVGGSTAGSALAGAGVGLKIGAAGGPIGAVGGAVIGGAAGLLTGLGGLKGEAAERERFEAALEVQRQQMQRNLIFKIFQMERQRRADAFAIQQASQAQQAIGRRTTLQEAGAVTKLAESLRNRQFQLASLNKLLGR